MFKNKLFSSESVVIVFPDICWMQIFGPIIAIMKFNTDDEAIDLANDTKFGLGCAVFSGSKQRANAIASKIKSGFAAINDFAVTYMCQVQAGHNFYQVFVIIFLKDSMKVAP